jgi:hypothetical protein
MLGNTGSPLSKHASSLAALYATLASIALIAIDLRVVLIPTACIAIALGIGGFAVFSLRRRSLVPLPAWSGEAGETLAIVINEEPYPLQGYEQELLIEVHPRHFNELLACLLLAVATLYVTLTGSEGPEGFDSYIGGYLAEVICIAGGLTFLTAWRFFSERYFLRSSLVGIGTILAINPGFHRRAITYQFSDQKGKRRGGSGKFWKDRADSVVLVMFNRRDPDANAIHYDFIFHSFRIRLLPGRRKQRPLKS